MEPVTDTADSAAPTASPEDAATPSVPGSAGRLTPEEHQKCMSIRDESRMLMQKIGELEIQKARIMQRVDVLDAEGQEVLASIARRVGITDQQWVALADGTIRIVNPQAAKEGAAPS